MNIKFTIFTPTYNRANFLSRCYQSIVNQNVSSLEWIIIDDGSTDNTAELIRDFISEKKINIRYFYQKNSGKQVAWNVAMKESNGTYFIGLDSDDTLVENSLLNIEKNLHELEDNNMLIGLRCLAINQNTLKPDSSFSPKGSHTCSWFYEFSSRIFGERIDILKTSIIKNFPYPTDEKIKFIPEIWFYSITAYYGYKFIYLNEPVRLFYDDHNQFRLSKSSIRKNARGHYIARIAMLRFIPMRFFIKNPIAFLKTVVRFAQCIYFIAKDNK